MSQPMGLDSGAGRWRNSSSERPSTAASMYSSFRSSASLMTYPSDDMAFSSYCLLMQQAVL